MQMPKSPMRMLNVDILQLLVTLAGKQKTFPNSKLTFLKYQPQLVFIFDNASMLHV